MNSQEEAEALHRVIKNEVYKLFAKKRIYVFMGILFAVALFVLAGALFTRNIFKPAVPQQGGTQDLVLSSLGKGSGQTFPLTLFNGVASFVLPVLVIILVSSLITDEYADGSLKLPLLRQVSRSKLLLGKAGALAVTLLILLLFLLVLGYGLGIGFLGWDDQFLLKGTVLSSGQGIALIFLTYGLSILSLLSFGMVILLFAVLISNSGSVVGIGTGILFASLLVGEALPETSPYLISTYFNTYRFLTSGLEPREIITGCFIIAAYGIGFYILSLFIFKRKDLLL